MNVRPATPADVAALASLYNDLGVATTASYDIAPVTTSERAAWLAEHARCGWPVLVADDDGRVVGYAAYGAFRPKAGYRHTVEHSVYVRAASQGRGVGQALLDALIAIARAGGVHAIVGLVDAENAGSVAFHERMGFATVGTLPQVGRKFGRWLDVTVQVMILAGKGENDEQ
ncbi:MAG: N-acetyltransferase family protein [Micrococcales bacterium]|nr:N-acetyltransferase family protein [Micrococcales bacterium]